MADVRVVVLGSFNADQREFMQGVDRVDMDFVEDRGALSALLPNAEVVAGDIGPDLLARAGRLRWIQSWAAGPNRMLYPELIDSDVVLTCAKGNGAVPLAEHAMLLIGMLNSGAMQWMDAQRNRQWIRHEHRELQGQTCGIIGLGGSGQDLAEKAQAFHMHVLGIRRHLQATPHVDEVLPASRLHELLSRSDFVVVTAPLTASTAGMLGEAEFRAMKPTASIVCISRGGIVDDDALLNALRTDRIAGAGLDAHGTEPLPHDSPFWTAPHTIITPHNGATTPQTRQRGVEIFVDNLRRYVAGRELHNVVDKNGGY